MAALQEIGHFEPQRCRRFRNAARLGYDEAVTYYESVRPGLGRQFVDSVDESTIFDSRKSFSLPRSAKRRKTFVRPQVSLRSLLSNSNWQRCRAVRVAR